MTSQAVRKKYQIFDIKQLAELEKKQKKICRQALLNYKIWQCNFRHQSDKMEIYYGQKEGHILRRYAMDTIKNYWRIRNDFRKAFQTYLTQNCVIRNTGH